MAEHAARIGVTALLVSTLPSAVPTEREYALNTLAIDLEAGLPIMLHSYPGRMDGKTGEEFFGWVGHCRNTSGVKQSSGDNN